MRTTIVLALGACGLAACAPMRSSVPSNAAQPLQDRGHAPVATVGPRPAPGVVDRSLTRLAHPRIDAWERKLRSHRAFKDATCASLERGEPYIPRLKTIMTESGLPPSLALLPAVESGFRPQARGHFGDLGLWQFRGPTARRFGLVVNGERDDRLHPERSTRAAARYLRFLHRRYSDWPLALAAYNAGEARVDRALARQPQATFWELADSGHLPRTSRDFVPRFIALVRISEDDVLCDQPAFTGAAHEPQLTNN